MSKEILVVDDEKEICDSLNKILSDEGYDVSIAMNGVSALEYVRNKNFDLIIIDIWMSGIDGFKTIEHIKSINNNISIIIISGHRFLDTPLLEVYDFIEKPFSINRLLITAKNALEIKEIKEKNEILEQKIKENYNFIEKSTAFIPFFLYYNKNIILIIGEEGTEKEEFAYYLYKKRNYGRFIKINCNDTLIESEMFGYKKGVFQEAVTDKIGFFEEEGTIFLENITYLNLSLQQKLLNVLKTKEFKKIGDNQSIKLTAQIICSTSKNLEEIVQKGIFLSELFQLLKINLIYIPSLRERKDDIIKYQEYFIDLFCKKYGKERKQCSEEDLKILLQYHWPYNTWQLRNVIENLVITNNKKLL